MYHPWDQYQTPDEFLADPDFRAWVRSGRFRKSSDPATRWLVQHPDRREAVGQAMHLLWASVLDEPDVTDAEVEALRQGVWQRVEADQDVPETPVRPLRWWGWAAAALVVLTLGWLGLRTPTETTEQETAQTPSVRWLNARNQTERRALVSLADGSTVWLEPGGLLRYPDRFAGANREVVLTGEAFFEVTKDARHPFRVRTRTLLTTVLGTSFTVRAPADGSDARVQVRTGRVAVYPIGAGGVATQPTAVLGAKEQVILAGVGERMVRSAVAEPLELATRLDHQSFDFTDAPIPTIFRAIERAYGVRIAYDPAAYRNCSLTTSLSDEPLTEKLRIVTATMGEDVHFVLEKDRIRVWGRGCP